MLKAYAINVLLFNQIDPFSCHPHEITLPFLFFLHLPFLSTTVFFLYFIIFELFVKMQLMTNNRAETEGYLNLLEKIV